MALAADEGDYSVSRPAMLAAFDQGFFDARLARTSPVERRLLQAIARCGEAAPLKQVVTSLRMSNDAGRGAQVGS